jgi:hypothetical protein
VSKKFKEDAFNPKNHFTCSHPHKPPKPSAHTDQIPFSCTIDFNIHGHFGDEEGNGLSVKKEETVCLYIYPQKIHMNTSLW